MKSVIIGTAGHIDHGKTTLVKTLTGIDPDRLPEEKARGLTIDIGFAFFDLKDDVRVNFIDVPGHERFIKNMLAGATGIDAALLVIAADDGIMPQTREHMEILELLDMQDILVAVTKCDLVEEDWLGMLKGEIQDFLAETKFKNSRIIPVSSVNNKGIDELKRAMLDLISNLNRKSSRRVFRLPIDRTFSVPGFGCVVTGSVIGGKIAINDEVELLPAKTVVRIRGIEVNGTKVNEVCAGQRAALNLSGIKSTEVYRGCELSKPDHIRPSSMVDCELYLHTDAKHNLINRTRIRFHIFTSEIIGRVILLDKEALKPGETGLAQFRLEKPITAERGDRYIIRTYSPSRTIGGGMVLRPNTRCLKRFKDEIINPLKTFASGSIADILETTLMESESHSVSIRDIQKLTNIPENEIYNTAEQLKNKGKLLTIEGAESLNIKLIHAKRLEELASRIESILDKFHKENPLKTGMEETALKVKIAKNLSGELFYFLLSELLREKKIRLTGNKVARCGFTIEISDIDRLKLNAIEAEISKQGFSPAPLTELIHSIKVENYRIKDLLSYLVETKTIVEINKDFYCHNDVINQLKEIITNYLKQYSSVSVAEFKDLTKTSRKYAVPLLEYLDKINFTKRTGDNRILVRNPESGIQDSGF